MAETWKKLSFETDVDDKVTTHEEKTSGVHGVGASTVCSETEADNKIAAAIYTEGARVYHSESQDIPTDEWAILAFDSERWDTENIHNTITNNSRLTCRTAGKYLIAATIDFSIDKEAPNLPASCFVYVIVNGITVILGASLMARADDLLLKFATSTVWDLAIDDYIEVLVAQLSGADAQITLDDAAASEFMMQRIG